MKDARAQASEEITTHPVSRLHLAENWDYKHGDSQRFKKTVIPQRRFVGSICEPSAMHDGS